MTVLKTTPRVTYDKKADVKWVLFRSGREKGGTEVFPGIRLELDERENIIGIEILDYSKRSKAELQTLVQYGFPADDQRLVS